MAWLGLSRRLQCHFAFVHDAEHVDSFRRVALLPAARFVLFQDLVDDSCPRVTSSGAPPADAGTPAAPNTAASSAPVCSQKLVQE
jgi:hypothetical protein